MNTPSASVTSTQELITESFCSQHIHPNLRLHKLKRVPSVMRIDNQHRSVFFSSFTLNKRVAYSIPFMVRNSCPANEEDQNRCNVCGRHFSTFDAAATAGSSSKGGRPNNSGRKCSIESSTSVAPVRRSSSVRGSGIMTTCMLAATAAWTPFGASSNTRHCEA